MTSDEFDAIVNIGWMALVIKHWLAPSNTKPAYEVLSNPAIFNYPSNNKGCDHFVTAKVKQK